MREGLGWVGEWDKVTKISIIIKVGLGDQSAAWRI